MTFIMLIGLVFLCWVLYYLLIVPVKLRSFLAESIQRDTVSGKCTNCKTEWAPFKLLNKKFVETKKWIETIEEPQYISCEQCGGLGQKVEDILVSDDSNSGANMRTSHQVTCHNCNGAGKLFDRNITREIPHIKKIYDFTYRCCNCNYEFITQSGLSGSSALKYKVGFLKMVKGGVLLGVISGVYLGLLGAVIWAGMTLFETGLTPKMLADKITTIDLFLVVCVGSTIAGFIAGGAVGFVFGFVSPIVSVVFRLNVDSYLFAALSGALSFLIVFLLGNYLYIQGIYVNYSDESFYYNRGLLFIVVGAMFFLSGRFFTNRVNAVSNYKGKGADDLIT